ncbi:Ubiquinone biosynthesis protein [Quaeritorhiza haematococci]|nr:Ubiquinone biosynthesis protein [Quaeritorhiza haematococci]
MSRALLALRSAFAAFRDPTRGEMVATLGDTTGPLVLPRIRDKMLLDSTGRRILRERPVVNSSTVDLDTLRKTAAEGTFGREYIKFLDSHGVSPDTRTPVKYIQDPELAYIMRRYREVHDYWHTLTGLDISVEAEIALKWLEWVQTGLPVAFLSSVVGPLRLSQAERKSLFDKYAPWAVQCGARSTFLLNIMYEDYFNTPIDQMRQELRFLPPPS